MGTKRLTHKRINGTQLTQMLALNKQEQKQLKTLIFNELSLRAELMNTMLDSRRDLDKECNYPDVITAPMYRHLYDRDGIAARVVEIEPDESWKLPPELYEADSQTETEFEARFKELFTDESAPIPLWSYLHRADVVSGIGSYGVVLIGLDDGLPLDQPVDSLSEDGTFSDSPKEHEILFLRVFDESIAQIVEWEGNPANPRYGQPTMYNLCFLATDNQGTTMIPGQAPPQLIGTKTSVSYGTANSTTQKVHWSRIVHISDNKLTNEVFGDPRLRNVYNYILNAKKVLGANGEGYWQQAFGGLSFETLPGLEDVDVDYDSLKEQVQNYMNKMQKYLALSGMTAKTLAPSVTEPTGHFTTQCQAVALSKGIPYRVFLGSEEAKLASGQDVVAWNGRIGRRRTQHLTPFVIRPVVDRFIDLGILPRPTKYSVDWPDLNAPSDDEKATTAGKVTTALKDYVAAGVDTLIAPKEYLVEVMGFDAKLVNAILKATEQHVSDMEQQAAEMQQQQQPQNPNAPPNAQQQPSGKPQQPPVKNEDPDFFDEWHLDHIPKPSLNFNPYHDELGRFAEGDAGGGSHSVPTGLKEASKPLQEKLSKINAKYPPANPHASETLHRYLTGDKVTPERQKLHQDIVKNVLASGKSKDKPEYVIFGGGTAAGKSNVIRTGQVKLPADHVLIDSDAIKSSLPEYQAMLEHGHDGAAAFVHEESSKIAKYTQQRALAASYHTVLDGTGDSSLNSLKQKTDQARQAGHTVRAVYVTVSTDKAVERAKIRAEKTGRHVPETVIRDLHRAVSQIYPVAVKNGLFDSSELWDTESGQASLVASSKGSELTIHNHEAWQRFLDKAKD